MGTLELPDALHAATALLNGCTLLMTNDNAFRRIPDLSVTVLSEIVDWTETAAHQSEPPQPT